MLQGTITRLLPAKHLGYVSPLAGGIPLLFNAAAVEDEGFSALTPGQSVTYSLERDPLGRGARAIHVCPVRERTAADAAAR